MDPKNNPVAVLANVFLKYANDMIDYTQARFHTDEVLNALNSLFPGKTCVDILYTKNTDKLFFGVQVSPTVTPEMTMNILFGDAPVSIDRYKVEIDSKIFDVGLESDEIAAYIIYEVGALVESTNPVEEVRRIIDLYITDNDDVIDISNSASYTQLFTFAIKDALGKVTSILYQDIDGVLANVVVNELGLRDSLISGQNKIRSAVFGLGAEIREPNLVQLEWVFSIYKDIKRNANSAIDTLEQSKISTASRLKIEDIDKTIASLRKVEYDVTIEATRLINESSKKGGFFADLKRNGMRAVEDDLYEYTMRCRNAESEEEAFYALRQINSRLALIEDYLYNNDLSEKEYNRWSEVARKYRDIRDDLSKKKIGHQKNYGIWYDYDKLDQLD